ncbi:hypothetical protein FH609_026650 [Streptomyces sp. 3MP-14]|uniref:Uncharacterized protein n=1 Tax=Streptomyces mimosae TaxID=2586635 RepID=A0A5N5ZZW2_9ACTN|nr:hypothetical protein FH607_025745 [Streptomyces mimosae]KAB8173204.1 hypothetical protein FH609_026650 [Streptomyces sp. 3MP-14]
MGPRPPQPGGGPPWPGGGPVQPGGGPPQPWGGPPGGPEGWPPGWGGGPLSGPGDSGPGEVQPGLSLTVAPLSDVCRTCRASKSCVERVEGVERVERFSGVTPAAGCRSRRGPGAHRAMAVARCGRRSSWRGRAFSRRGSGGRLGQWLISESPPSAGRSRPRARCCCCWTRPDCPRRRWS